MGRRGLGAVWWGMVTFFVLRLIQHGVHVVALSRVPRNTEHALGVKA